MPKDKKIVRKEDGKGRAKRPRFQLEDTRPPMVQGQRRRRRSKGGGPRIHVYPYDTFVYEPPAAKPVPPRDGKADGVGLLNRLLAIKEALEDLPGQAKRYLRWVARREKMFEKRLIYTNPIRPGPPPRVHKTVRPQIEEILQTCHWLAWEARKIDTS